MATPYEKFDGAAGAAACQTLDAIGATLVSVGTYSLVTGAGGGLLPLGMASLLASKYACPWDPNKPGPAYEPPLTAIDCYETVDGYEIFQELDGNKSRGPVQVKIMLDVIYEGRDDSEDRSFDLYGFSYIDPEDQPQLASGFRVGTSGDGKFKWTIVTEPAGPNQDCVTPAPPPNPLPDLPDVTYDAPDGCSINVVFKGIATGQGGIPDFVWQMSPGAELRANGGVIGGCNFSPVIYSGNPDGPGEPPYVGPWDPEWDDPSGGLTPWGDFLRDLAGGIAGNIVGDKLAELFATPLPAATYKLIAPCDEFVPGVPKEITVEIPTLPTNIALATRIEALIPILQGQKDFKQPICPPAKAQGDLRTIGFISENYSPNGRNYLRKRVRYRSVSGLGLNELIDYWKDFEFDAGPVIVKHVGSSWGTVTVWAASIAEGKRVIRHAAGEASVDADQVGRWEICSSTSSRLGMPGRMKVNQAGGYYWITARDGSDARPMVGTI